MSEPDNAARSFRPAKGKVVLALCAAVGAAVLALCAWLCYELRFAKPLDARGFQVGAPEGLRYEVGYSAQAGALTVRGWAAAEGERLYVVNNRIALYDADEDKYTELPSVMEPSERAVEVLGETPGTNIYAGVTAVLPLSGVPGPLENYEICFVYENNYDNHYLVHTGVMLEGSNG